MADIDDLSYRPRGRSPLRPISYSAGDIEVTAPTESIDDAITTATQPYTEAESEAIRGAIASEVAIVYGTVVEPSLANNWGMVQAQQMVDGDWITQPIEDITMNGQTFSVRPSEFDLLSRPTRPIQDCYNLCLDKFTSVDSSDGISHCQICGRRLSTFKRMEPIEDGINTICTTCATMIIKAQDRFLEAREEHELW